MEAKINEQGVLASAAKLTGHAQTGKGVRVRAKRSSEVPRKNSLGNSYEKAGAKG